MTTHTGQEEERGLSLFEAARKMGVVFKDEVNPTEGWVTNNKLRLHYLDWGNPHLPPLLFFHGNRQQGHTWDFACLSLRDRYHCIALDQRGHGDSDWSDNGDYTSETLSWDVFTLIKSLNLPPVILVGSSMGGLMAYVFTSLHPEMVRALCIIDAGPGMAREGASRERMEGSPNSVFSKMAGEIDTVKEFVDVVQAWNPRRSREHVWGSIKYGIKQLPNGKWAWKGDQKFRLGGATFRLAGAEKRHWDYIKSIEVPTLLVIGAESKTVGKEGEEAMLKELKHGESVWIEGAGHLPHGDKPAVFNAELRAWLERIDAQKK